MNQHDIQLLYEYNHWANARILGAAAKLTEEQYLAPGEYRDGPLPRRHRFDRVPQRRSALGAH